MSKLLFLAVVGLAISSVAQSPPPSPTPTKTAQEKQHASNRINSNSDLLEQVTILLKKQNESAERQRKKDSNKSSSDWWLVGFTGALTFVGIVQLIAMFRQASYMRRNLDITKLSADAAKESADTAAQSIKTSLITERAIILIDNVEATMTTPASGLDVDSVIIITLKNFGQTIAYDVELEGAITGTGHFPIEKLPPATIAPQGGKSWFSKSISSFADTVQLQRINGGTWYLGYKINVTYRDAFEATHKYHCEGRYEPSVKRFLVIASTSD